MTIRSCPACQSSLPEDATFCGVCGFRLKPISKRRHDRLSQEIAASPALEGTSSTRRTGEEPVDRPQRFPIRVEVDYHSEHNFYTGFLENLSKGGLFVATHTPMVIGQRLELSFTVPGLGRTCATMCTVRWIREYNPATPDIAPGMGCMFDRIEADVRAAIELFIQHREPLFFDDD
ncbi:MAG: TIGR02266 family protein [Deltaproteobacteria bacterium]|nr:TIGR02266 family protein [Deltaproteobacteria bacterium]